MILPPDQSVLALKPVSHQLPFASVRTVLSPERTVSKTKRLIAATLDFYRVALMGLGMALCVFSEGTVKLVRKKSLTCFSAN